MRHDLPTWSRAQNEAVTRHEREREQVHRPASGPLVPPRVEGTQSGQRIVIHPVDVYRRLPSFEAIARQDGIPVKAVWATIHVAEGYTLRGSASLNDKGEPHVHLVLQNLPCALHRLGTFRHELEHVRRGDVARTAYSPFRESEEREAEAACEAAGKAAVREWVEVTQQRATVPIQAEVCATCYREARHPCPQGAEVFDQVNTVLGNF